MAKVMNAWPSAAGGRYPRRFQQGSEHPVDFPVHQRLSFVRNEDMVATASRFLAVHQVVTEALYCGVVQRHQSGFLKLGSADEQTVGRDVGNQQMQGLRDPQTGRG